MSILAAAWAFVWKYRRIVAPVIGALVLGVWITHSVHAYGARQYAAGAAAVQAKYDAVAAKQATEVKVKDAANAARNAQVIHGYKAEAARITADRDSLAQRLHDYEVRADAVPASAGGPGAVDASAQPSDARSADAEVDANDRACQLDAAQLNALIDQIKPQAFDITPETR